MAGVRGQRGEAAAAQEPRSAVRIHMLVNAFVDTTGGDLRAVRARCATAFGVNASDIQPFRLARACTTPDGAEVLRHEASGTDAVEGDIAVAVRDSSTWAENPCRGGATPHKLESHAHRLRWRVHCACVRLFVCSVGHDVAQ